MNKPPHNWKNGFGPAAHYSIPAGEEPYQDGGICFLYVRENSSGRLGKYNFRTDLVEFD